MTKLSKLSTFLCVLWGSFFLASTVFAKSVLLDQVIAIVNNDIVMQSELQNRIQSVSNRLKVRGTPLPPDSVMRQRVLDQLILESIQLQRAERAGIRIDDTQVNETISSITRANNMTLEQFELQLKSEGETYASARKQIRNELIITRVQQREVDRRVRVTDQEISSFLDSKQGRTQSGTEYYIGHILIAVSESATLEQRAEAENRAEQILIELKDGKDFQQMAVARSDGRQALNGGVIGWRKENELPSIAADIIPVLKLREPSSIIHTSSGFHIVSVLEKRGGKKQIVTQFNVRHILISPSEIRSEDAAKEIIEKLQERILNGDDFVDLAKSNSDDPVSAIDGGSLGWVGPGQMVREFERVMLETPIGETSEPFRSKFGWHILQVIESRDQDIGAQIQENQAKRVIHRRKYEEELANWLLEIKSEAFIDIKERSTEDNKAKATENEHESES